MSPRSTCPAVDPESGKPLEADDGGGRRPAPHEHHEIDLEPVLHDEFALTEPMHPLCRPDCGGICAECGRRLDAGHVAHGTEEIDPRLASLASLLGEDEASE